MLPARYVFAPKLTGCAIIGSPTRNVSLPAEVWPVIDRFPPDAELAAIAAELDSPFDDRRDAAERALGGRR